MTAEIVVLNKEGVAMATDSAVTSRLGEIDKISSSANKLFSLSTKHPVGVMVYGNSSFMGIPWETIIKVYRSRYLPPSGFAALADYADHFVSSLRYENIGFHRFAEANYVQSFADDILRRIVWIILNNIKASGGEHPYFGSVDLPRIVNGVIDQAYAFHKASDTSYMTIRQSKTVFRKYHRDLKDHMDAVFRGLPLDDRYRSKLRDLLIEAFSNCILDGISSGVVIAGFGENELLPVVRAFRVEGIAKLDQKGAGWEILKYAEDDARSSHADINAAVIPYAQGEMVCRFMDGVDPDYVAAEDEFLTQLFADYAAKVASQLDRYEEKEKAKIRLKLSRYGKRMTKEFSKHMEEFAQNKFADPTVEAVGRLSKSELAVMAEALVYVTSLKRKVSPDSETVSEPIDVAVISKGDGFVWIKRKHYFEPKLNPAYFTRRQEEVIDERHEEAED